MLPEPSTRWHMVAQIWGGEWTPMLLQLRSCADPGRFGKSTALNQLIGDLLGSRNGPEADISVFSSTTWKPWGT